MCLLGTEPCRNDPHTQLGWLVLTFAQRETVQTICHQCCCHTCVKPCTDFVKTFLSDPSPIIGNACHSLTDSLTPSCLVNLIDVTLVCEDVNSKLVEVVTLLMLMLKNVLTTIWCRFGSWSLVIKLNFCSDFEQKDWFTFWSWSSGKILKLKFGMKYFAADAWLRLWN